MSSPIWTRVALSSEFNSIETECWRFVEAQNRISTYKLTDSRAEHDLLEQLIEKTKPPMPLECQHLDFLLFTPFRYNSSYPKGSRFRRAGRTDGVFYAASSPETALAETAFYQLLFFAESPDTSWPTNPAEYTAFSATIKTDVMLDLTSPPLEEDRSIWTDLNHYQGCQDFADAARKAEADIIKYTSVRDPNHGSNFAILRCRAFALASPTSRQTWHLHFNNSGIRARCEFPKQSFEFSKETFVSDHRIKELNWERKQGSN